MSAHAVTLAQPDRIDSLNVPLLRSRGADMVSVRYDALVQLASGLIGVTLDDIAAHLAAALHDAVECDLLHIVMLRDDPDSAEPSVFGRSVRRGANVWTDEARLRWGSEHQQPLRLGNTDDVAVGHFGSTTDGAHVCRSFCGVPLRVARRPVGALCVATRAIHPYSAADERLLTVVADRVALAA